MIFWCRVIKCLDPFFCCAIFLYPLSLPKPTTKSDHIRDGRIKKGRNFLDIGIIDVHQDLPGFLRDLLNKNDILVRSACAIVDDDNDSRDLGCPADSVHRKTFPSVMTGALYWSEHIAFVMWRVPVTLQDSVHHSNNFRCYGKNST